MSGRPAPRAEPRGRPRMHSDDEILDAALRAFAAHGFDGMSVRSLNTELGLSHGSVNQRFRSKEQLYYAAIDHGFATFLADIAAERAARSTSTDNDEHDDLEELRELIRAFLMAAARRPELGRLMNQEGLHDSPRLEHIVRTVLQPVFGPVGATLPRLAAQGRIHPVSARALFFLVAHGAEAPYTLTALSASFDDIDGPLDHEAHADATTELIMRGLRR